MSNSATHGLYSPWHPSGQNTGVGSRSLLWGIFPTQGSNSGLPHCRWILYQLSHQGSPEKRFAQRYSLHLLDTGVCVCGGGWCTKEHVWTSFGLWIFSSAAKFHPVAFCVHLLPRRGEASLQPRCTQASGNDLLLMAQGVHCG